MPRGAETIKEKCSICGKWFPAKPGSITRTLWLSPLCSNECKKTAEDKGLLLFIK